MQKHLKEKPDIMSLNAKCLQFSFCALLAGFAFSSCSPTPPTSSADLVFQNGQIYTVEATSPWVEALGVKDGKIIALGNTTQSNNWIGEDTKVVDLKGKFMMPSFGDAHVHPVYGGLSYSRCSLHQSESIATYLEIIQQCVDEAPDDGVVYGQGWLPGLFPPNGIPEKSLLDSISSTRPIVMRSTGGHSLWVNSAMLELANITKDTPDPPKGRIDRDPDTGEPIGGFQESAMELINIHIPEPTSNDIENAISYTLKLFNSLGITNWFDAGIDVLENGDSPTLDAYESLQASGKLTSHISIAAKYNNERSIDQLGKLYDISERAISSGFNANAIKLYTDGVIVQKTAAVLEAYEGTAHNHGELHIPIETLKPLITKLDRDGYQTYVHSIGDRAVHEALNAFEQAKKENGANDNRHFLTHLNFVAPIDHPRFAELNVSANFQPLWATNDPYMKLTALQMGAERMKYVYPVNSILQSGGKINYGSDWSVAPANPFYGLEVAVTRKPIDEPDAQALNTSEAITLEDAVKAYTLNVAYITHRESETGSIAIGKSADLIIADQNIFEIPENDISDTKVLTTVFKGKVVYGSFPVDQ